MYIRTTEREHQFTSELFEALNAYSLQGLTLTADLQKWTAAIEAVQFDDDEDVDFKGAFPVKDVTAKLCLARAVGVPLYFIAYRAQLYFIFSVNNVGGKIQYKKEAEFSEDGFISWWKGIKGTIQTKDFNNGAQERVSNSIFDRVLAKHNLLWGGNIDGFILREDEPVCIIDNIYSRLHPLDSSRADPANYFFKRGPNYNTWLPTVKLAQDLDIPHLLFTIDGNNNRERIGLTVIDHLSSEGIFYLNGISPNQQLVEGKVRIVKKVQSLISFSAAPYIE